MMRYFNTAGPVRPDLHYCIPPLSRVDLPEIEMLMEQQKYFVLHAPRQTGKTSLLLAMVEHFNTQGRYTCLYSNVENAQAAREDVSKGMQAILSGLGTWARDLLDESYVHTIWPGILAQHGEFEALNVTLTAWALHQTKPLVVLLDEVDALLGDTLIAVLRQLRSGYPKRPHAFPQSMVLCGVRDVRDYRIHSGRESAIITGGSAFNIKAESLRLGDFTQDEVVALYAQHTTETGQVFTSAALDRVWDLTRGQPWLVNALGYETCFRVKSGRDRHRSITVDMIEAAKDTLIERRETHLDQLVDKLQEERVRRVIEPLLSGATLPTHFPTDDLLYVRDLGLIRTECGHVQIANIIYQEIIPRELTFTTQLTISQETVWFVGAAGRIDMDKLLTAFQQFFREHSEHWVERFDYKEAGPQLLLQAFLQRIINGGGRIEREYGLGRKRTDLLVLWPYHGGIQRVVLELKIRDRSLDAILSDGLAQTWAYMDRCGAAEGHLVLFDRSIHKPWEEKIFTRAEQFQGHPITVWGM